MIATKKFLKTTSELEITVLANRDDWKNQQTKVKQELANNLTIPGFRTGKAPAYLIGKHISNNKIWEKAAPKMLNILIKEAIKKITKEDKIIGQPYYNIAKISDVDLAIAFIYPVLRPFKMIDYKNLTTKCPQTKATKVLLDQELKNLQKQHTLLIKVDRLAKLGDVVKLDYKGLIDNKPFEGGLANAYQLELGSNNFIPGFETQLIGTKANQVKKIKVRFPKDYQQKSLQNKLATFDCKILEVNSKKIPEINDQFAKELKITKVSNLMQLKQHLKASLEQRLSQKDRLDFSTKAITEIKSKVKINIPESVIEQEARQQQKKFLNDLQKNTNKGDKLFKPNQKDMQITLEKFKILAKDLILDSIVYNQIFKLEGLEITENDFQNEYQKLANKYQQTLQQIQQLVPKNNLEILILQNKVIDKLLEYNKV